nr:MAG TPA: hypothetical protein [Caudoviricetes sp.]
MVYFEYKKAKQSHNFIKKSNNYLAFGVLFTIICLSRQGAVTPSLDRLSATDLVKWWRP